MSMASGECSQIIQTLQKAASQDVTLLKSAEAQLKTWETQPGFHGTLVQIFMDKTVDISPRLLAVMFFKNGIDRFWRKGAPNAMSEEEKEVIRSLLISSFEEEVVQVALQKAVLISRIARLDVPRYWDALLPTLLDLVQRPGSPRAEHNVLLTLYHVTETLASKRLAADRRAFSEMSSNIFTFLVELYNKRAQISIDGIKSESVDTAGNLQLTRLVLKTIRKISVHGFREMTPELKGFTEICIQQFTDWLKLGATCRNQQCKDVLCKLSSLQSKLLLDLHEAYPVDFIQFIVPSLQLTINLCFSQQTQEFMFEKVTVNLFNLFKGILLCEEYIPPIHFSGEVSDLEPHVRSAVTNIQSVLSSDTVMEVCRRLICSYFLLTIDDLEIWANDPEEFMVEECGDAWKYDIRPCTERVFLTLFKCNRELLTEPLLNMLREYSTMPNLQDIDAVRRKDAVYNAVGLVCYDLFSALNFNDWFKGTLATELQVTDSHARILRRRVLWLCTQWMGEGAVSRTTRLELYDLVLPRLHSDEDMVVRLEASKTVKAFFEDFEFGSDAFIPYLDRYFVQLFQLLKDVRECDTKIQVLGVLSFMIERLGAETRPLAAQLAHYLPLIWAEAEEHNMLRCAIVACATNLVQALGEQCVHMYDFVLPVLALSTDLDNDPSVYLLEDGLDLWLTVLYESPCSDSRLLQLFGAMQRLIELGTDTVKICFNIIEATILIGKAEFLQSYGELLVRLLIYKFNDVRHDGVLEILKLVELVIRMFPAEGALLVSPFVEIMLKSVVAKQEEYPAVEALQLSLLCRVLLQNFDAFSRAAKSVSQQLPSLADDVAVIHAFLQRLCEQATWVTSSERRKICALAAASLLSQQQWSGCRWGDFISLIVEVLHDVCSTDDETGFYFDTLVITDADDAIPEAPCCNDRRYRELNRSDPVHSVSLRDYTRTQFAQVQTLVGEMGFQQLVQSVDSDVWLQLDSLLSDRPASHWTPR